MRVIHQGKGQQALVRQYMLDAELTGHVEREHVGKEQLAAAVVGGALIRVVVPANAMTFRPAAHNHMFILLDVRVCRVPGL